MRIIVVDTETTGINPNVDEIVQLAAVDFLSGASFNHYIISSQEVSPEARKKNGLTKAFLEKKGLPPNAVAAEFTRFLEKLGDNILLAGWNPGFDYQFIQALYRRCCFPMPKMEYKTLDVFSLYFYHYPTKGRYSLDTAAELYGLERQTGLHNALDDALLTKQILQEYI